MKRIVSATLLWAVATACAQNPTTRPAAVVVDGDGVTPLSLSIADLAGMPRRTLDVKDHDGRPAAYEGVALRDVLLKAGLPLGQKRLKGPLLGKAVIVTAADGYRVAFGLAEFDADYAERDVLLADRRDGRPLSDTEGPFRLVVPQETRQGRWVRMVTRVRVIDAK